MKHVVILPVLAALLLVGCKYETPLTREHNVAVDPALLGLWESIPDEGDEAKQEERMMILKYSETEYLLHYPVGKDGVYYRSYPIKIGDISCVQLQAIGDEDGSPKTDEKDLFHVASYRLRNAALEIKLLNTDLVADDLKTSEALVDAFEKNKDNVGLFSNPERFRRIKK